MATTYTVGQLVTYRFCGGTPGSVVCVTLPGKVTAVTYGNKQKVTVALDNGFPPFTVPASDGALEPV